MMEKDALRKYEELKQRISSYTRVGIAFSGGIDSSLLLYAAAGALDYGNFIAVHGRSPLTGDNSDIENLYENYFKSMARLEIIDFDPLGWPDFTRNDEKRCYYCKKRTYNSFFDYLRTRDIGTLLDGTNRDDLDESRAGHAVLQELGVKTPLLDIGLRKKEIRFLGRFYGLPNCNAPSNSCLATRLQYSERITADGLQVVRNIEKQLNGLGFTGCRARPFKNGVIIELRDQDYQKITLKHNRLDILERCREKGFEHVYITMKGR